MLNDHLIKTLADVAFMASSRGMPKHSFGILDAIEKVRPDSELPSIGYAMNFVNKKMNQEALEVLHKEPNSDNPTVKAFIGLVLMLEGRNSESEVYLNSVLEGDNPEATAMAQSLLESIHEA